MARLRVYYGGGVDILRLATDYHLYTAAYSGGLRVSSADEEPDGPLAIPRFDFSVFTGGKKKNNNNNNKNNKKQQQLL